MKDITLENSSITHPNQPQFKATASDIWRTARVNVRLKQQTSPIQPFPRHGNLPLSFNQEWLWLLEQLQPDSSVQNILHTFRLKGLLNLTALEQSLSEIARRHEILRTTFPTVDKQPIQFIAPNVALHLPVVDLRELPPEQRVAEARQLALEEADRAFDLAREPLWRVKLIRLAEEEYVLVRTIHHIIFDGWSCGVFARELAVLYEAFSAGKSSPLPELPIQYADFAQSQRQRLQGEILSSGLDYWKQKLSGNISALELPTDYPRPPVPAHRGAYQSLVLSENLTEALKTLSYQHGISLFVTLLAAFKTLLYRYTGQEDIIMCSPVAGRHRAETRGLIGCFINVVLMRTDLSGNLSFQELLHRVSQVTLEAYEHQEVPLQKLAELPNLARTQLNGAMFVLQNTPSQPINLAGLDVSSFILDRELANNFELALSVQEKAGKLTAVLQYNTMLFNASTIARMLGHFQTLLEGITANPQQRISDLPLLTAAERYQLLVEWNDTQTNYQKDACIHQLFEAQVERTPDAVAVVFEDQQLTYRQLDWRANQLAHYLQTLGVGPEVLVGICIERSLEMVVGVLGILKVGGAYVPLDPAYPQERLGYMLQDSQVPVLVTQQSLKTKLPGHKAQVICLDTDWTTISASSVAQPVAQANLQTPATAVTSDNLAYIIYTSGSTGKPKGVQIQHRSAVNLLNAIRKQPGLAGQDTLLSVTTLSFDIAVSEIFLPLSVGARLVLVSREVAADSIQLLKVLNTSGATFMQPTPATWRLLLAAGWQGSPQLKMISTGEALPSDLAQQLLPKGAELWNLYGPTETTIWSTAYKVESDDGSIYIGRPIDNTQIYILDSNLQLVPIGVAGELYIGGDGLARGYLNRPDLTVQRFIPNPFSSQPGARLYKTGDLVRYLPDGQIECLGRIDHQVKIRGFRIELGEVESSLGQHPAVRQAVVTAKEDSSGNKRLVAYIVPNQQQEPTATQLRRFLKQNLPDYMVPSAFVMLDTLPLTPNGKVDRRALPAPDHTRLEQDSTFIPPQNELELQLTKIWEEVLGIQPIGVKDNFFDSGGNSLLAVSLFAQIRGVFDKELPLSTLMTAPTIKELASLFCPSGQPDARNSLVLLKDGKSKTPLFLIHDGDGETLLYRNLAYSLKPDPPVYGVQPYSKEGHPILHTRIAEMVAYYIEQIRTVQPEGPYLLGGLCAGGVLAFEIARQLQLQGQQIAMVALIDVADIEAPKRVGLMARYRIRSFAKALSQYQQPQAHKQLFHILNEVKKKVSNVIAYETQTKIENIRNQVKMRLFRWYLDRGLSIPQFLHNIPVRTVYLFAREEYVPQAPYIGEVALFRATEGTGFDEPSINIYSDPLLGWGKRVTAGVKVYDIPGGHSSMLQEPNVQVLAEKMQAYISAALEEPVLYPGKQ